MPEDRLAFPRDPCGVDDTIVAMDLVHREPSTAIPLPIVLAKLRVRVAVGVRLQVTHVQELQGHAHAAPPAMKPREVWRVASPDRREGQCDTALGRAPIR